VTGQVRHPGPARRCALSCPAPPGAPATVPPAC